MPTFLIEARRTSSGSLSNRRRGLYGFASRLSVLTSFGWTARGEREWCEVLIAGSSVVRQNCLHDYKGQFDINSSYERRRSAVNPAILRRTAILRQVKPLAIERP